MSNIKIKKAIPFLGFACFIIFSIWLLSKQLSCKGIFCISIKDSKNYKIGDVFEDNKFIYRALYHHDNILLKAEIRSNYTPEDAEQLIQTQLVRTKGLFEDAAAPYPGELSDVIACSNAYKPVYSSRKQNGVNISYFEGYVNKRLVFGSCADDQAAYHDTLTMFYCSEQKKFYQVEIIMPTRDFKKEPKLNDRILSSISCKRNSTN